MHGVFACPECGTRIDVQERSAGRQVRCGRCRTLVEVPFFPREFGRRRWTRRPWWRPWVRMAVGGLVVVLVAAIGWQWRRASVREARAEQLASAMTEADAAERRGDIGAAFRAIESARLLAESYGLTPPGGLDALDRRRDALARREIEVRLSAISHLSPDRALGEALTLSARVSDDPALRPMADTVARAMDEVVHRWLAHHLDRAESMLRDQNRPDEAFAYVERLDRTAATLPLALRSKARSSLGEFVRRIVAQVGVVLEPVVVVEALEPGGPPSGYDLDLRPRLHAALLDHGYLPGPSADSFFASTWKTAPNRFQTTVVERHGARYLGSPNRTTRISVDLVLSRDADFIWSEHIEARSSVPLPGLNALEASRFAVGTRPNPELEHTLYEDARADLLRKLDSKLRLLPDASLRVEETAR